jgi:hypothetical protein
MGRAGARALFDRGWAGHGPATDITDTTDTTDTTDGGGPQKLLINGKAVEAGAEPAMPLLWVRRDLLGMTAPSMTAAWCVRRVHGDVDGQAVRSCAPACRWVLALCCPFAQRVLRGVLH